MLASRNFTVSAPQQCSPPSYHSVYESSISLVSYALENEKRDLGEACSLVSSIDETPSTLPRQIHPALRQTEGPLLDYVAPPPVQRQDNAAAPKFPIIITNRSALLHEPFPYHDDLYQLQISPNNWAALSEAIRTAATLTRTQCAKAIGAGVGVGPFSPRAGLLVGVEVARRLKVRNVRSALLVGEGLHEVLDRWNNECFGPRGLVMRIALPGSEAEKRITSLAKGRRFSRLRVIVEKRRWNIVIERKEDVATTEVHSEIEAELGSSESEDIDEHLAEMSGDGIQIAELGCNEVTVLSTQNGNETTH